MLENMSFGPEVSKAGAAQNMAMSPLNCLVGVALPFAFSAGCPIFLAIFAFWNHC